MSRPADQGRRLALDDPRHGTYAGAVAHWFADERPCDDCARAEWRYRKGRKLDALHGNPRTVPAIGVVRRIEALHALGWSGPQIADTAGISLHSLRSIRYHRSQVVRASTACVIEVAYRQLCMTRPEGRYADRQRSMARRRGWVPPLAWDDIDHDLKPWQPTKRTTGRPERVSEVLAEYDFLTSAGEPPRDAAARLGVTLATIRDYRTRAARRGEVA